MALVAASGEEKTQSSLKGRPESIHNTGGPNEDEQEGWQTFTRESKRVSVESYQ